MCNYKIVFEFIYLQLYRRPTVPRIHVLWIDPSIHLSKGYPALAWPQLRPICWTKISTRLNRLRLVRAVSGLTKAQNSGRPTMVWPAACARHRIWFHVKIGQIWLVWVGVYVLLERVLALRIQLCLSTISRYRLSRLLEENFPAVAVKIQTASK